MIVCSETIQWVHSTVLSFHNAVDPQVPTRIRAAMAEEGVLCNSRLLWVRSAGSAELLLALISTDT